MVATATIRTSSLSGRDTNPVISAIEFFGLYLHGPSFKRKRGKRVSYFQTPSWEQEPKPYHSALCS